MRAGTGMLKGYIPSTKSADRIQASDRVLAVTKDICTRAEQDDKAFCTVAEALYENDESIVVGSAKVTERKVSWKSLDSNGHFLYWTARPSDRTRKIIYATDQGAAQNIQPTKIKLMDVTVTPMVYRERPRNASGVVRSGQRRTLPAEDFRKLKGLRGRSRERVLEQIEVNTIVKGGNHAAGI